jgi:hypothetical protein
MYSSNTFLEEYRDSALLHKWIPLEITITEEEYLSKFNCNRCEKYGKYKIESDINFDVYYWLNREHQSNFFAYNYSEAELMETFNCKQNGILKYAKEIGLLNLVKLCTYHALWIHFYTFHYMGKNESKALTMIEWDSMTQPGHVNAKNNLNFLIYLLLTSDQNRNCLMKEIRDFSLCPPLRHKGIYGYEYSETKRSFYSKLENS